MKKLLGMVYVTLSPCRLLQMDAIKARKSAAKAFSASLEHRNAELRQHSSRDAATPPAHTPSKDLNNTAQVRWAQHEHSALLQLCFTYSAGCLVGASN